jgi:PleD family two-component response regulator
LVHAGTSVAVTAQLREGGPDLVLIDGDRSDVPPTELCRRLRHDPHIGPHTPILIAQTRDPSPAERVAALRSGAWDVLRKPLDVVELPLRINTYVQPKLTAEAAMAHALVDLDTGLYNVHGLARRLREAGHVATRRHAALACVAIAPRDPSASELTGRGAFDAPVERVLAPCVQLLRAATRAGDVIGRLGSLEFAVIAPDTDAAGAERLRYRLAGALDAVQATGESWPSRFGIGVEAVANLAYASLDVIELLGRACAAARRTPRNTPPGQRVATLTSESRM